MIGFYLLESTFGDLMLHLRKKIKFSFKVLVGITLHMKIVSFLYEFLSPPYTHIPPSPIVINIVDNVILH